MPETMSTSTSKFHPGDRVRVFYAHTWEQNGITQSVRRDYVGTVERYWRNDAYIIRHDNRTTCAEYAKHLTIV